MSSLEKVLERHRQVVLEGFTHKNDLRYSSYAVSNLRGGVGKTSLTFNLAYEMSMRHRVLLTDVCPQANLTEIILGEEDAAATIYQGLQPKILGPAFGQAPEDMAFKVGTQIQSFNRGKGCFFIAGDAELYSFPSSLYQQLQVANTRSDKRIVKNLLDSLKDLIDSEAKKYGCEKTIIDTSPFYAGATHLAWHAVDALIVPVRVDEHSVESLGLLFGMLSDKNRDFLQWEERAGNAGTTKIAAVVMTMAGAKSQKEATPDAASRMYIQRALETAEKYPQLFDSGNVSDSFVITDDFMSAGRISGAKSIPISELKVGSFHSVDGKRLQVNSSAQRYQRELAYLVSVL